MSVVLEQGDQSSEQLTDANGAFSYTLESDSPVTLSASKEDRSKANRAVDVSDIGDIIKHIKSVSNLDGALSMIAADVNRDDQINVTDIVSMQKVILYMTDSYSNDDQGNALPVWRILDASVVANLSTDKDAANYVFNGNLAGAEEIQYNTLGGDISDANFVAIKLGDAQLNWTPDGNESQQTLGSRDEVEISEMIQLGRARTQADGRIAVDVYAESTEGLIGMQYELKWDEQVLELESMENHALAGFRAGSHSNIMEGGHAVMAWYDASLRGVAIEASEPVMTLHFSAQPGADRGTSIELLQTPHGLVRKCRTGRHGRGQLLPPRRRNAAQQSRTDPLDAPQRRKPEPRVCHPRGHDLRGGKHPGPGSGQWEAITTVEGSGRHEVIEMPTTEQAQAYLRVREVSGVTE